MGNIVQHVDGVLLGVFIRQVTPGRQLAASQSAKLHAMKGRLGAGNCLLFDTDS
jgi:hypothetical protein